MLQQGGRKYLASPIIGLLPFVLFIILYIYNILSIPLAIGASLLFAIVGEFILRKFFNSRIHILTLFITSIALILTAILWYVGNSWILDPYTYTLIGEVIIIIQLIIMRLLSPILKVEYSKNLSFLEKSLVNDFFQTSITIKYVLIMHIFSVLCYRQITQGYYNPLVEHIIYVITPIFIILFFLVYYLIKTNILVNKLRKEEWLPIVSELGEVTGRIAKSVSQNLKNTHLHPVVRVALVCNKKVYLQERNNKYIIDPKKLDHPFEKYMLFKHEVNQAAHNVIGRMMGENFGKEPDFVSKYVFENNLTKRLIFLFIIRIDDESLVKKTPEMTGKFWTTKQIDEEFTDEVFSECFELEYEYLKHMVLLQDADSTDILYANQ